MGLKQSLKGAKIKMKDDKSGYTLAWFGGHGVHAYDDDGTEVAFWNTGDFAQNHADKKDIIDSMKEVIKEQNYSDYG